MAKEPLPEASGKTALVGRKPESRSSELRIQQEEASSFDFLSEAERTRLIETALELHVDPDLKKLHPVLQKHKAAFTAWAKQNPRVKYYLSAKNADIKTVKRSKKQHKPSLSQNNDPVPAVKQSDVGAEYAEIVYRHLSDNVDTDEDDDDIPEEATAARAKKAGKKRRPHARRAHWQHYWTGEGRKNLELRWKSDLFVGASRDDQATVVYEVSKESLKGKRNPNTSKKKKK